jgi:hypothetical protein
LSCAVTSGVEVTMKTKSKSANAKRRRRQRKQQQARRRASRARPRATRVVDFGANPNRIYRPGRLAELFDVDGTTIWRWSKNGTLPQFVEIGGIRGLTEQQVTELLEQRRQGGTP